VKSQSHYFEIKDIITQFISAFDDVVINRYDKSRSVKDKIQVTYVYSPKQRVIHDLVNKSQHIKLPVISITQSAVSRDESRVFNKLQGTYHAGDPVNSVVPSSDYVPPPVPINIGINMSILTKYQADMDQILQNFIVYSNPYIEMSR
jgi:hypothetical protein